MKKSNAIKRSFAQFIFKQNAFEEKKYVMPKDAIVPTPQ